MIERQLIHVDPESPADPRRRHPHRGRVRLGQAARPQCAPVSRTCATSIGHRTSSTSSASFRTTWSTTRSRRKPEAFGPLKAYADAGRALIGAHLHPWVSPPHEEEVNARNSYPGNLPRDLEHEKLRVLTDAITAAFGARPLTYLAGRYGFGPHTGEILESLGYEVDISAGGVDRLTAPTGGPITPASRAIPTGSDARAACSGCPAPAATSGGFAPGGTPLYRRLTQPWLRRARVSGAVARLRLLERIRLSPEDYSEPEMRRLTQRPAGRWRSRLRVQLSLAVGDAGRHALRAQRCRARALSREVPPLFRFLPARRSAERQ